MKYTKIREQLSFKPDKEKTNGLAYLTHYLHNYKTGVDHHYTKQAEDYLYTIKSKVAILGEPNIQYLIPIKWDIPFPSPTNPTFKFIDLFAGIGGFRIALQKAGGKCVFSSEIDKAAKKTYESNFGEVPFGDLKEFTGENITDEELNKLIPDHDVLAAGFPCQPFSRAGVSARNFLGKMHGFDDTNQGNLFFDIVRIAKVKRPKVLFLENVKNLKIHDEGRTFKTIQDIIEKDLNYKFFSKVINSETLVPQRRERTYIVCFRDDLGEFDFPEFKGTPLTLRSILDSEVDESFTISDKLWEGHINRSKRNKERGTGFTVHLANLDKPSNTIVARYYKDGKECLIPQQDKNPRKLTPHECAKLQGYPEQFIISPSNVAAYKQFGNSVAVPVIEKISMSIIEKLKISND